MYVQNGIRDEAGASMNLRMERHCGSQETVRDLLGVAPGDAKVNQGVAGKDNKCPPHDRREILRNPGPIGSSAADRLHGGNQQRVLGCKAQGPRVSVCEIRDHHALLRRR